MYSFALLLVLADLPPASREECLMLDYAGRAKIGDTRQRIGIAILWQ